MKLQDFKRIRFEDFSEEEQNLIEKLAFPINDNFESVYEALQSRLTFGDNVASTSNEFTTSVDANGVPRNNIFIKLSNNLIVQGLLPIKVVPLDNVFPLGGVGLTYQQTTTQGISGIIISNIQGLPPLKNFTIKVLVIN